MAIGGSVTGYVCSNDPGIRAQGCNAFGHLSI